jgi:hypothetical protein
MMDQCAIAWAFIAKAIYNMTTTIALIDCLHTDKSLRQICGWERKEHVPSESTFSRAFSEFAKSELPQRVHATLIQDYHSEKLVEHNSRDSTTIGAREKVCVEAREKAKKKENEAKTKVKAKRGRSNRGEERAPKEIKKLERQKTMTLKEFFEKPRLKTSNEQHKNRRLLSKRPSSP